MQYGLYQSQRNQNCQPVIEVMEGWRGALGHLCLLHTTDNHIILQVQNYRSYTKINTYVRCNSGYSGLMCAAWTEIDGTEDEMTTCVIASRQKRCQVSITADQSWTEKIIIKYLGYLTLEWMPIVPFPIKDKGQMLVGVFFFQCERGLI